MLYLFGSIFLSSYLTLAFKFCERYGISIFQAIVFNYITCVLVGSIVNGGFPINAITIHTKWFQWACIMGMMFIATFNVIGITSQKMGVAVTSVSNKLSLIIPVVLSVYLYHETVQSWKLLGVILGLIAVVLTCYQTNDGSKKMLGRWNYLLPIVLFISSGLIDALINHVQHTYVNAENNNAYLISVFFAAASIGSIILIVQMLRKKQVFQLKNLLAGILIGIPNYFSIWCLVHFLQEGIWPSSASIPVNNMGIVLFSSVTAWVLFKERLSKINWMGIVLSLIAIYLIAFGANF